MKKRNLFLSLVCSIILTVALVAVTVASVFAPSSNNQNGGNTGTNISNRPSIEEPVEDPKEDPTEEPEKDYPSNEENDGSEEKPYIIYNAESFMNLLNEYGDQEKYFVLDRDVDFAGIDFVTLFQDKAFNGHINGNGYALKNISVNINSSNLDNFIVKDSDGTYVANVAVFGKINKAEIANLVYDNVSIEIADETYDYIRDAKFVQDHEETFKQLTVGIVAAIAEESTINVEVNGSINADAYAVYSKNYVQGYNAVGGVVGVANKTTIDSTKVDVTINANVGSHYFVGGVAAYAIDSKLTNNTVELNIVSEYDQVLYVGGVAGYVIGSKIEKTTIKLTASQAGDRFNTYGHNTITESDFTSIAGIVNVVRADNENQITTIENISVNANVDADIIFAGALVEVRNADLEAGVITDKRYVSIKEVIVEANVNVLKAFGFAKKLVATTVDFGSSFKVDTVNECIYNIKLTGNVRLNDNDDTTVSSLFVKDIVELKTGNHYFDIVGGFKTVNIVVSSQIYARAEKGEVMRLYSINSIVD